MLTVNRLKEKLRTGQKVFGLIASIPAALTVEMIGHAGYDFVIIDMEHVMINPETVEHMIRAAEATYITTLVRVPEVDTKQILRVLDSGAQGIVIPHVESREQMEKLVQAAKYSPLGKRSLSSGRPAAFGKGSLVDYMKQANEQIMLVPMIESRLGVERIADILSVPGPGHGAGRRRRFIAIVRYALADRCGGCAGGTAAGLGSFTGSPYSVLCYSAKDGAIRCMGEARGSCFRAGG